MSLSSILRVKYGITKGQIYDAFIQHGWSDSLAPDTGLPASHVMLCCAVLCSAMPP